MGTVIVGVILIAIVAAIIISMVRRKKAGKSLHCNCVDCGGACGHCNGGSHSGKR
ncbi:MAG: FeoB-associated Cys-rich membrane protein [Eubacterium sp.]|jgi:hypothetical protein|nr:FeoB-associated Cys-rich membrane protein [Eubacterium sp.]